MKSFAAILLLFAFLLGGTADAQETNQIRQPEDLEEVKELGKEVGKGLPDAMLKVWNEQVVPVWLGLWNNFALPALQKLWDIVKAPIQGEIDKRRDIAEQEFEKEKEELKESAKEELPKAGKSLWERFKDLLD